MTSKCFSSPVCRSCLQLDLHSFRLWQVLLICLVAAPPSFAEDLSEKFQFHGFMTQAYAQSSYTDGGPTPNEVIVGIPEDGTTDYRFLALQFRYEISEQDLLVVQLSSRSLGDSPINKIEDDIELDWAFYQRRLTDNTSIKVGRVQIPLGIFNEIRDVGTILPFYRPPYIFYREGSFTSETVDGILLHHSFFGETDWPLDLDVFYGEYELVEQAVFVPDDPPAIAVAKDARGIQLWLNTPYSGLRIGIGGQKRDVSGGQEGIFRPIGGETEFEDWYVSAELPGQRYIARIEHRALTGKLNSPLFGFSSKAVDRVTWFQLGYYFTEKIHAFAQWEQSEVTQTSAAFTRAAVQDVRTDTGVSVNYRFSSNVVLKGEYHWVEEEALGFIPTPFPDGSFLLDPIVTPFKNGNYSILSLAVSF